jgi:hypothetical protein
MDGVMNKYAPYSKDLSRLYDCALRQWDRIFDQKVNLCGNPGCGSDDPALLYSSHYIRDTFTCVIGFLARNRPGDRQRANAAIKEALKSQLKSKGAVFDGTFKYRAEDPSPRPGAGAWEGHDPNWREFIGCLLAITLIKYSDLLEKETIKQIDDAMLRACEGSYRRAETCNPVLADNILLMHLFIMDYYGRRYGKTEWVSHSEIKTETCWREFMANKTFKEFNSPTYYGVDLDALTLMKNFSGSQKSKKYADDIIYELWRDVSLFYHPVLKNICGPFVRAYGINMNEYPSGLGEIMYLCLGENAAPFPKPADVPEKENKFFWMDCGSFFQTAIENRIPADFIDPLLHFSGPHGVRKLIMDDVGVYLHNTITAWLDKDWMMGGFFSANDLSFQRHPFTLHWKNGSRVNTMQIVPALSDGTISKNRNRIKTGALVDKNHASICAQRISDDSGVELYFEIVCEDSENVSFKKNSIKAGGITLKTSGGNISSSILYPNPNTALVPLVFNKHSGGMEELTIDLEITRE